MINQKEAMNLIGWITIKEAAEMSGTDIWAVHRWIKSNRVKSTKAAGHVYVNKESLMQWIGPIAEIVKVSRG